MAANASSSIDDQRDAAHHRATTALVTATSVLLPELERLSEALSARHGPLQSSQDGIGVIRFIKHLRNQQTGLRKELEALESEDPDEARIKKIQSRLQGFCPEVGIIEQKWGVLKRCKRLSCVSKSFMAAPPAEVKRMVTGNLQGTDLEWLSDYKTQERYVKLSSKLQVAVAVTNRGYEWIYIKGDTTAKLIRCMADAGWDWGVHERGDVVDKEEWGDIQLAVVMKRLCEAAKLNRVEYMIPRVRVVLPRLDRNEDGDVAVLLEQLERIDPHVKVSVDDLSSEFLRTDAPTTETAISNLAEGYDPFSALTPTLNLDTTVLISLISDITHCNLPAYDWQAEATRTMIIDENNAGGGLMARRLWSVLSGRHLVCTNAAAQIFHEVLKTVGTNDERERGYLLIPKPPDARTPEERRARFNELSTYPPPSDVRFSIKVLSPDQDWESSAAVANAISAGELPTVAQAVVENGLGNKQSIFLHGWFSGDTTVTCDKGRVRLIKRVIEANRTEASMQDKGPKIFELGMTRNLLAKNARPP